MTTYAQLLADIRVDLKDAAKTKWDDDTLYIWVKDAIKDYSVWFPEVNDRLLMTLDENFSAALPIDYIQDFTVESPQDTFLERRAGRPGSKYTTPASPTLYFISGGRLYLNAAPTGDVLLTYGALHTIPTSSLSTTTVMSIPSSDEELVRLYVSAKANEQVRTKQSSIDRFKLGAGRRDDNPVGLEVSTLMDEYYAKIAERTPGGSIALYRQGRRRV
jgi:hypothetical protein